MRGKVGQPGASSQPGKLGLVLLCLFLAVQPFHFIVSEDYPYYREIFAAVFLLLLLLNLGKAVLAKQPIRWPLEVVLLFFSLGSLLFFALIDPGTKLYNEDYLGATEYLSEVSSTAYILRNAFLYVPMVLYFARRGLSDLDLKLIATTTVLVAPVSIYQFLVADELIGSWREMGTVVELGGNKLAYNSYVPYLTFPVVAAIYLAVVTKRLTARLAVAGVGAFLFLYIVASSSRQSLLYVFLVATLFFLLPKLRIKLRLLVVFLAACFIGSYLVATFGAGYVVSHQLVERYGMTSAALDTPRLRLEAIINGVRLLSFNEFIGGAGLTSVVVSGPHNDYIRWTQRVGVFGMLLSFLPYFVAFLRSLRRYRRRPGEFTWLFIASCISFLLFHSLFGYPREDAFQAPYAFLGLALWLGYRKSQEQLRLTAVQYS